MTKRQNNLTILLALTVAALVLAAPAVAATKDMAYRTARSCLIREAHASLVVRRSDGGGIATWNNTVHGGVYWTYKTWFGQVETVTYYSNLPAGTQRIVKRCLFRNL